MNAPQAPLVFAPNYKGYLWGGDRIATVFKRIGTPPVCAESWEISAHPDGDSVVLCGACAGERLSVLAARFGAALTGTRAPSPGRFPLLFKLIDARDRLSVQVHPSNATAAQTCGEPKTEMWHVLERTPGATLYAGLSEGVSAASLRDKLAAGTAEGALVRLPVEPGQSLFIPGGLVHAIGAGCLIYEVQQSSNTTYRLYDWNRAGADGKPRALHLEESFKTIDWSLARPRLVAPNAAPRTEGRNVWNDLIACPFFTFRKLSLAETHAVRLDGSTFHALFVEKGRVAVSSGGGSVRLQAGASSLIPAAAGGYTLAPETPATLLVTTL